MCMACEEGDLYFRWQLVEQIAKGELPAGHTAEDLRAMGLPLPGELIREEQPDGSFLIRQVAPKKTEPNNAFVCDSPDNE
jgi:hypothetical protein